jgi:hypothetical protein
MGSYRGHPGIWVDANIKGTEARLPWRGLRDKMSRHTEKLLAITKDLQGQGFAGADSSGLLGAGS